jgi:hypothetical protein
LNSHIWFDDEKVSAEEKDILERVFSEEEIKNKIDHMENNKAARSDGIPAEFYK